MKPIETEINSRLTSFEPTSFKIVNESHNHQGSENKETHFRLLVVSDKFKGLMKVKRHQMIYSLLTDLINNPIHALSLHLHTQEEFSKAKQFDSPPCAS